jgi:hypothetical protein
MYIYIYVLFYSHCYNNYSFIYLYKGYASYIHIARAYLKHKRLRTTALRNWDVRVWNGCVWLSAGSSGEMLRTQ